MKKHLHLCVMVMVLLTGFGHSIAQSKKASDKPGSSTASGDRNRQALISALEFYNANNIESFLNAYDKDVVFRSFTQQETKGVDSMKADISRSYPAIKAAFPDFKRNVITAASDGDYVTLWEETTGTWKGDFMSRKATQKSFKFRDVVIYKFNANGKIIEEHQVTDPVDAAMSQLGFFEGVEGDLNTSGYKLLFDNKITEAIEVFKLNVKLYPNAWNTYDSLGEAYAISGNKDLAIENYEKSMQLNPINTAGKRALEKLRAK